MKKLNFFIQACQANMPLKLWWLTMCFASTADETLPPEDINFSIRKINGQYQYRLNDEWLAFEDAPKTGPLFKIGEPITVEKGQILNIKETMQTNVTRLVANCILFTSIFNDRLDFLNKKYQISDVVNLIQPYIVDDKDHVPGKTYSMSEYLKLCDRSNYITTLSSLFFMSSGPELIEQPAWVKSYRAQLIEQYKDELHKPETAAKIDAALVKKYMDEVFDKDTSSRYIVNHKKQIESSVKKTLLSYGAEFGIGSKSGGADITYIPNSLIEGVDPKSLPALYNAQRSGSYGRGKETQEGGASVKEMMAATQNFTVDDKDCGSRQTVDTSVTESNKNELIGCTAIVSSKPIKLDENNIGSYLGKTIGVRSPLYCKSSYTSWCVTCLGDKLTVNKDGLPVAVVSVSSALLLISMAKSHSKGMSLVKLDLNEVII